MKAREMLKRFWPKLENLTKRNRILPLIYVSVLKLSLRRPSIFSLSWVSVYTIWLPPSSEHSK